MTYLFLSVAPNVHAAPPSMLGQTGLINMPDARIGEEGTLRFGVSFFDPYGSLWSSISFLPRLEISARYTSLENTDAFSERPDADFGTNKDKAFDTKLLLIPESRFVPAISIGAHDFLGTQSFAADFFTISKKMGEFDLTIGAGTDRIDGAFGGVRFAPENYKNWSFLTEFDAFDYKNDPSANESGANTRKGGFTFGINYTWGWLGSQLAYQNGDWGINAYLSIPLMWPEFIPKIDEPKPYTQRITRPSLHDWQQDNQHAVALIKALETQAFKNVRVRLDETRMEVGVATPRISLIGRAAGRVARTALLMSPQGVESIKVTYYTLNDMAVVSYQFLDLQQLDQFFSGKLTYGELLNVMKVEYAYPALALELDENKFMFQMTEGQAVSGDSSDLKILHNEDGHAISLKKTDTSLNRFRITPFNMGVFFNDPSGAFKYDIFARAEYQRYFGNAFFFNTAARMRLLENVSDVKQPSNSLLPHVRSDVAEYKRQDGLKLETLLLNKFFHIHPRIYGRWSLGVYEEMFGGTGGQILYLPKDQDWATDLTVDWVKQRDFKGGIEFQNYQTVTALAAVHYRVKKYGLTFTLRGGRFLAKDNGARLEIMRRFRSGVKVGAWYTYTDGNDITGPGSPGAPYQDKGIFMQIPLGSMLTKDTRAASSMSLSPWTRDVGQMVKSPGDLYDIFEDALLLDRPDFHLLSGFHE
ncbi:MAG: YjbH domain-containing protein [Gammaproteobacteria bacterium]|nr:YjbH domain-containing protein [Gammaproteobacteria bacterium]